MFINHHAILFSRSMRDLLLVRERDFDELDDNFSNLPKVKTLKATFKFLTLAALIYS